MRIHILIVASLLAAFVPTGEAAGHELPPTVYEAAGNDIPPQAMDYDEDNKVFVAHPGWLNDKLIHYYKFRMYVPGNYQTDPSGDQVPIQPLYLPTTAAQGAGAAELFSGVPAGQYPILSQFPTAGNTDYSDFQHIVFVHVADGYMNDHKDHDSLMAAGLPMTQSGIVANVPVVPEGSRLEDPDAGRAIAPISGWPAWYDGHMAQTFAFESTSQAFADYINPLTRDPGFEGAGSGYEATVGGFATTSKVDFLPIWHVNQYQTGVTAGVNHGGPSAVGQRNVISHDRLDSGYSPLWQVFWAKQVPIGYSADHASHPAQFGFPGNEKAGFVLAGTPMFVNCPNIGPHGGTGNNPDKGTVGTDFGISTVAAGSGVKVEGSLIMAGGAPIDVKVNGQTVGSTTSGMMGWWTFHVEASALQAGANTIEAVVMADAGPHVSGETVATWSVHSGTSSGGSGSDSSAGYATALIVLALIAAVVFALARYGP